MKKKLVFLVLLLVLSNYIFSDSQWEGSAAMGRYGEFPSNGFYGASNSFARDTLIEVLSTETNKKVKILIVDRLSNPGLFLLLSKEAAKALDIPADGVVRVKVTHAYAKKNTGPVVADDLPFSSDPDTNPAAYAGDVNDVSFLENYVNDMPEPVIEEELAEETDDAIFDEGSFVMAFDNEAEPEIEEEPVIEEEPIIIEEEPEEELVEDLPADDTFLVYDDQVEEVIEEPLIVEEVPEEETEVAVEVEEEFYLEPAEERPASIEGTEALELAVVPAPVEVAVLSEPDLEKGSFYLQLGVFAKEDSANNLATNIKASYPVEVYPSTSDSRNLYKVLVGPLSKDESGAALYSLKEKGYKDAFLRKGSE